MHDTRLSIFILPVLIIGLSIFTTYVEENPSFASLFSISQVANPTAGEESGSSIEEVVSDAIEGAEEIIEETQEVAPADDQEGVAEESSPIDTPVENPDIPIEDEVGVGDAQGEPEEEPIVEPAPAEESQESGGGGGQESESEEPQETESPATEEPIEVEAPVAEEELPIEEIPVEDAVLLAQKIAQYEVSKSMVSSRFQQNLLKLEVTRDELYAKIAGMEQAGKDVSRAKDALANLEDAIAQSRRYMRDSSVPDSIPGVQKMLIQYVKNIRDSLQTGYTELFNVIKETQ
jgi:hypothetical protein